MAFKCFWSAKFQRAFFHTLNFEIPSSLGSISFKGLMKLSKLKWNISLFWLKGKEERFTFLLSVYLLEFSKTEILKQDIWHMKETFGVLATSLSLLWTRTSYMSIMKWALAHDLKNASSPPRGLCLCFRLWFPPEAASMCTGCCGVSLHDPLCALCWHRCVCACARPGSCIQLHKACILVECCPAISSKAAATAGKYLGKTGRRNFPAWFIGVVLGMSQEVSEK